MLYEVITVINEQLVRGGISVYRIRVVTRTLEDQFIELTGGVGIE